MTRRGTTAPANTAAQSVESALRGALATLSPRLRKAARFALAHRDAVALKSLRAVARDAGLQPGTLSRLARALGYADYAALKSAAQRDMLAARDGGPYVARARDLQDRGRDAGAKGVLAGVLAAQDANLARLVADRPAPAIEQAVAAIERARTVRFVGDRGAYAAAYFFAYVYAFFRDNGRLCAGGPGALADALADVGIDDTVVAISTAPYSAATLAGARYAVERGAIVVALTDRADSPLGAIARHVLTAPQDTPSFFGSIVPSLTLVETLLAALVARGGTRVLDAIARAEERLEWFGAYEKPEKPGRGNP
jgi:DNA-binding MurR/RpiR family transcriptional regulator